LVLLGDGEMRGVAKEERRRRRKIDPSDGKF
jgi:hypothetical protein